MISTCCGALRRAGRLSQSPVGGEGLMRAISQAVSAPRDDTFFCVVIPKRFPKRGFLQLRVLAKEVLAAFFSTPGESGRLNEGDEGKIGAVPGLQLYRWVEL